MANHWDPFSPRIFPSKQTSTGDFPARFLVEPITAHARSSRSFTDSLPIAPGMVSLKLSSIFQWGNSLHPGHDSCRNCENGHFWRFPNPIPPKSCLLIWSGHPKCEWLWGSSSQVWLKTDHVCNTKQFIIAVLPITGSWNRSSFSRFKCHLNPFDSNGSFEVFPIFQADPRYSHYNYRPLHHCVNVNHMSNPFSVRFIGESPSFGGQSIPQNSWQTPPKWYSFTILVGLDFRGKSAPNLWGPEPETTPRLVSPQGPWWAQADAFRPCPATAASWVCWQKARHQLGTYSNAHFKDRIWLSKH